MQKKDDKMGNKTANKEERQRKKESERESQKKIGFCACLKNKKKNSLITSD